MKGRSNSKPRPMPDVPARADGFRGTTVLIVGDVMMDCYVLGDVHRISQEAPVPVVALRQQRWSPGGAANVAMNVAGLRASAIVAGVVGSDAAGERLAGILNTNAIGTEGLITDPLRPTTTKTRIMCGNHQIVRLDEEVTEGLDAPRSRELLDRIMAILDTRPDAVILSDYAKGVLSDSLLAVIIGECRQRGIPSLVDPKRPEYVRYAGATCITPNFQEFQEALLALGIPRSGIEESGPRLRQAAGSQFLLVTRGAEGMTLFREGQLRHVPAVAQEVFDVSGAGDTVIGTLATCMGAGLPIEGAMLMANIAASLVVRKVGTAPIVWDELARALADQPLREDEQHLMAAPKESSAAGQTGSLGRVV